MSSKSELHLVPEAVKNIVARADKSNPFTNANEKFMAMSQLEAIVNYCKKAIETVKAQK